MKRDTIIFLKTVTAFMLLLFASGCQEDEAPEIKLGGRYGGGIIFYIDSTGKHGLIASTSDQSRSTPWWNGSFIITGATNATNGSANTTAVINAQGNGTYAAKLCRDFRGGGKSDWFLPSKNELNILYGQKDLVGGFVDEIYWSSTEEELGAAWVQFFLDGSQGTDNTSDEATTGTRAIRAF